MPTASPDLDHDGTLLRCDESFYADFGWATPLKRCGDGYGSILRLSEDDFLKHAGLLEEDGALVARAAARGELKTGADRRVTCTRVYRGFWRLVSRLCNVEWKYLEPCGPSDAVALGEDTVHRAAAMCRFPALSGDLNDDGTYWVPPPGTIEPLEPPLRAWQDVVAALIVVFAFTHADGVHASFLRSAFGYTDAATHDRMRAAATNAMREVLRTCTLATSDLRNVAESAVRVVRHCRSMPLPPGHQNRAAIEAAERDRRAREEEDADEDGFVRTRVAPPGVGGMY